MPSEWLLIFAGSLGANFILGVFLYYSGKKTGKLQEQNLNSSRLLSGQAQSFRSMEAQIERADLKMQKIMARIEPLDLHLIPDPDIQRMFKNPTLDDIPTHPEAVVGNEKSGKTIP